LAGPCIIIQLKDIINSKKSSTQRNHQLKEIINSKKSSTQRNYQLKEIINSKKSSTQRNKPTRCSNFTSLLLDVLYRSTCFGRLHAHNQELLTALTASGFTMERGGSSLVGRGLRPRPTKLLPPRSKVKPEVVSAVVSS
jgi:hypothetical protein